MVSAVLLAAAAVAAAGNGHRYAIRTNPMTCDYCAYDLEQALLRLPSVSGVEIDIDGVIYVTTTPGHVLSADRIKALVLDHGFDFHAMTEVNP